MTTLRRSRITSLTVGAVAGATAALAMTCAMLLLRLAFGFATPPELIGDRIAPLISISQFGDLIRFAGGYNQLKSLGVGSALLGQILAGALIGGLVFAVDTGSRPASNGRATRIVVGSTILLWIATLVVLSPTLPTQFGGLPRSIAPIATAISLAFSYATFGVALQLMRRLVLRPTAALATTEPHTRVVARRAVLSGGIGLGLLAATGGLLEQLRSRATFAYDGLRVDGPEITAITPNDRFYVVSKNVVDPSVNPDLWRLEVRGHVERELSYDAEALAAGDTVVQETTLMCISNPIGGGLMSNALWTGVPLANVLHDAGVRPGAVEVLCHAVDGYSDSIPIAKALDPSTILAFAMNDEPLPERHGFPVRLVVPGLYGEKSVKWISAVEVVDREVDGFYEQQGWGPDFVIPTRSRFSGPDLRQPVRVGETVQLVGQAFAGDRGIKTVEVSSDGGQRWEAARLDYPGSQLSWALWSYAWTPQSVGSHALTVRATDRTGQVQTARGRAIPPQGATGLHTVPVMVVR